MTLSLTHHHMLPDATPQPIQYFAFYFVKTRGLAAADGDSLGLLSA